MMDGDTFRPLTSRERGILDKLFQCDFTNREVLRPQLDHLTCKVIDEYDDEYGSLEFRLEGHDEPWGMGCPVVEGEYLDEDGVPICIVLHIRDDQFWELEIFKADGGKIINTPSADQFAPVSMRGGDSQA